MCLFSRIDLKAIDFPPLPCGWGDGSSAEAQDSHRVDAAEESIMMLLLD
jgi:hypothetical protein